MKASLLQVAKRIINSFFSLFIFAGIVRDKTIVNKLLYIPNDNKHKFPLYRLTLEFKNLDTPSLNQLF